MQVQVQLQDQNQWSDGGEKRNGTSIPFILFCPLALLLLIPYPAPTSAESFLLFLLSSDLRFPKIVGSLGPSSASGIVEEGRMRICGLMANLVVEY